MARGNTYEPEGVVVLGELRVDEGGNDQAYYKGGRQQPVLNIGQLKVVLQEGKVLAVVK